MNLLRFARMPSRALIVPEQMMSSAAKEKRKQTCVVALHHDKSDIF
jgi:hypothetical protein